MLHVWHSHMNHLADRSMAPRKTPRQARSVLTVDAVFEATLQVLLSHGLAGLTTTRVAERTGVSVGTLYQYFPNKQVLLHAVLERHLNRLAQAMEAVCRQSHRQPLDRMVENVVQAFVDAKTARVEEARALYRVAAELDASALVGRTSERMREALCAMLATAADRCFEDLPLATFMVLSAMVGPTRAVLEGGGPPEIVAALRGELVTLCQGYLDRVSAARTA